MVLDLAGWFISERFTNKPRRPTESKRKKNGEKRAKRTKKGDDFPENEQNVDGRKKEKNSKHQSDDVTGRGQGIDPEVSAVGALLAGIEHSLILENGSGDLQILIANHDTYRPTVRGVPFSTVRERKKSSFGFSLSSRLTFSCSPPPPLSLSSVSLSLCFNPAFVLSHSPFHFYLLISFTHICVSLSLSYLLFEYSLVPPSGPCFRSQLCRVARSDGNPLLPLPNPSVVHVSADPHPLRASLSHPASFDATRLP